MNRMLLMFGTTLLFAGCASGPQTVDRGVVGLQSEQRVEGQRAREAGLSDRWVLKAAPSGTESLPAEAAPALPMTAPQPAAGTSGTVISTGTGQVEMADQADIELHKEELVVGKKEVSNGSVLIRKVVQSENVSKPIDLQREEYVIERVPSDQARQNLGPGSPTAFQGREIYLPLMREEPVASKRILLSETVTLGKKTETDHQTITQPVRSEDIEIVKNPDLSQPRFANLPHRTLAAPEALVVAANPPPSTGPESLNLVKEELIVGKKPVENGGVYLQKIVRSEDVSVPVDLRRQELTINRTSAGDQPVSSADFNQREIRVDLTREQPVVGVRNYVTEVVRLRKQMLTEQQVVSGMVRKESVEIVKSTEPSVAAPVGTVGSSVQSGSSSSVTSQTITGKAVCTKCQLKETASCQNAIQVKDSDQVVTYYLSDTPVTQEFHEQMARPGRTVSATGIVQNVNGKLQLMASKITIVK